MPLDIFSAAAKHSRQRTWLCSLDDTAHDTLLSLLQPGRNPQLSLLADYYRDAAYSPSQLPLLQGELAVLDRKHMVVADLQNACKQALQHRHWLLAFAD